MSARGIGAFLSGFSDGATTGMAIKEMKADRDARAAEQKAAAKPGESTGTPGSDIAPKETMQTGQPTVLANAASSDPVKGGDAAQSAFSFLTSELGWKAPQAAAALGHLVNESGSGLDPRAVHDGGTGIGIAGWRDPSPGSGRKTNLMQYAGANKLDPYDRNTQLRFLDHELRGSESSVGNRFFAAGSVDDAASIFTDYERPGGWKQGDPTGANGYQNRIDAAKGFYSQWGASGAQASTNDSRTATGAPASGDTATPASGSVLEGVGSAVGKALPGLNTLAKSAGKALATTARAFAQN